MRPHFATFSRSRIEVAVVLSALIEYMISRTLVASVLISFLGSGFNLALNRQSYRPALLILWLTGFATLLHLARITTIVSNGALDSKFVMLSWLILAPSVTRRVEKRLTGRRGVGVVRYGTSAVEISTALGAIALILLPSYLRSGGMPTWAMSGDSRNHLLISRDVVDNGGFLWWNNYPSLFNSLTSLASGWRLDGSPLSAGELTLLVQVQACLVATVLFLLILTITAAVNSGVHTTTEDANGSSVFSTIRLATGAFLAAIIATSNWLLRSVLEEGFFPILLALLIASAYMMTFAEQRNLIARLSTSFFTAFLLLSTFPPAVLVPVITGAFDVAVTWFNRNKDRSLIGIHTFSMILSVSFVFAASGLGHLDFVVNLIRRYLGAYGRISPLAMATAVVLIFVVLLVLVQRSHSQQESPPENTLIVGLPTRLIYPAGTALAGTFFSLNPALGPSYYRDKSLLVVFCVFVVTVLVSSSGRDEQLERQKQLKSLVPIVAVATVVTFLPIQGNFGFRIPPTVELAVGWKLPTDGEASLIRRIDDQSPGSVPFNMTGDPLAQRVMAIWTTGALPSSGESVSWAYSADISDLAVVCDFAERLGVSVVASGDLHRSSLSRIC